MKRKHRYDWVQGRVYYDRGLNDRQIARELGHPDGWGAVRMWRNRLGLKTNCQQRPDHSLTPAIRAMLRNGVTVKQIAAEVGCDPAYVRVVRKRHGDKPPSTEAAMTN